MSSTALPAKHILVTGAAGFVGGHLLERLRLDWPAARITATSLGGDGGCLALDITDADAVADAVRRDPPDYTVHLAAQASVGDSFAHPQSTWDINLQGSLNLFNALLAHAPRSGVLFISSSDCYGASFRSGKALDENALLQPQNPYAASKAAADLAAGQAAASKTLRVVRARPFNHAGPGQGDAFVLPAFAHQIARIEAGLQTRLQVGNLTACRDFLHVSDVCRAYSAILQAMEREGLAAQPQADQGEIINIASGAAVPVQTVLDILLAAAKVPIEVQQDPKRLRPSDIPVAAGNADKLQRLTGWQPHIDVDSLVLAVLDDWRQRVQAG